MSGKVLFACSKCFSRHPFEELSSGTQLCKNCRGSTSIVKCTYCRSEFQPNTIIPALLCNVPNRKSQSVCKKCEHNVNKYGKPSACECCKIVAAFGGSKCMRCASYEAKYGPPVQCDECKLRSAFDRRDENKKVNGKLLCWLCTCAYKRALLKAQQDGRIPSKKRPHERSHRDSASASAKKSSRSDLSKVTSSSNAGANLSAVNSASLDLPEKISRAASSCSGNGSIGLGSIAAPAVISIDPNSADHVVAITTLKERIASLEKRLSQKDKELLEKDKLLTELKGKNYEKEMDMRNKLKEIDRLHEMKVENLNRKVASLLKEIAGLKKSNKKNGGGNREKTEREKRDRENFSPKEELTASITTNEPYDKDEDREERNEKNTKDDRKINENRKASEEREKSHEMEQTQSQDNEKDQEDEKLSERSLTHSGSRSRSQSNSRSHSHSRSQSRSNSGSRSRSGTRSNSADSN
uniref:Protein FAM76A n=1 Tax=Glossina brevipalpis TaxID=37001 RepID=A0A1A9W4C7_9MUSC